LAEMTSFPKARFDDQVDSTSQALEWLKNELWQPGMGLYNYMKEMAEGMGELPGVH
jgi:hypothetical protein